LIGKQGLLARNNKVGVVEVIGVISDPKATLNNLKKFRGKKVVVLHSGAPESNKGLVELFFLLSLLNR